MHAPAGTPATSRGRLPGLRVWWLAIRPRTLTLSAVPVVVGSALAWQQGCAPDWPAFAVALAAALLIQAGTNLFNDAADFLSGNDGPSRVGPLRVSAAGLATPGQVRLAAALTFAAAFAGGIYLAAVGGWPIIVIGLASLAAGWAYSGGPRPLSHTPWGEVFVMVFFGLVAVEGSAYLQGAGFAGPGLLGGIILGAHAAAVLLVNNLRDLEPDAAAGRRTLAAALGPTAARRLYGMLMLLPFPLLFLLGGVVGRIESLWPTLLALPLCAKLALRIPAERDGPAMNRLLARTAQAQLLLGGLLTLALLL